eukprot:1136157-Pelagomonas_calceolata.AAC.12
MNTSKDRSGVLIPVTTGMARQHKVAKANAKSKAAYLGTGAYFTEVNLTLLAAGSRLYFCVNATRVT